MEAPSVGLAAATSPAPAAQGRIEVHEMHELHGVHGRVLAQLRDAR